MKGDKRTCPVCGELIAFQGLHRAYCLNPLCENYDKEYKPKPRIDPMYPDDENTPIIWDIDPSLTWSSPPGDPDEEIARAIQEALDELDSPT